MNKSTLFNIGVSIVSAVAIAKLSTKLYSKVRDHIRQQGVEIIEENEIVDDSRE